MDDAKHDLLVHCCGSVYTISDVVPDRYSHLDLLFDACEKSLKDLPTTLGVTMTLHHSVPGSTTRKIIEGEDDVLKMFDLNKGYKKICVFLETSGGTVGVGRGGGIVAVQGPSLGQSMGVGVGVRRGKRVKALVRRPFRKSRVESMRPNIEAEIHHSDDSDSGGSKDSVGSMSTSDDEWIFQSEDEGESSSFEAMDGDVEAEMHDSDSHGEFSDYGSDDNAGHYSTDGEDDGALNMDRYIKGRLFEMNEGQKIVLEEGLLFSDVAHFRTVLREYAIQQGFRLVRDKNEKCRVTAHCGNEGCSWRIHASPLPDMVTFKIKTLQPAHTCIRATKNPEVNSVWIGEKLVETLRTNPDATASTINTFLVENYGVEVGRMQLYRGKRKALDVIEGNHGEAYAKLPKYAHEILKTNSGSLVKLELERVPPNVNLPTFKRFFISFAAIQNGFKQGCRPFIGVDGCHLKGPYKGVLLAAIALDGNNGLFPLAIAMVESECEDSWSFFLSHLVDIIGDEEQSKPWTVMSDGQKGIEAAMLEVMPWVTHRRCCRHIFNNMKVKVSGLKLRKHFWIAARAHTEAKFTQAMKVIEGISKEAYTWLQKHPSNHWARYTYDSRVKCDHITNNLVESFNNWIVKIREKPVLVLVDSIRKKLMSKLHKRYVKCSGWQSKITPGTIKKLDEAILESRQCKVVFARGDEYEVLEMTRTYIVNFRDKSCCCKEWDITGIPCKHAAACCASTRRRHEDLCDDYFSRDNYVKAYSDMIHPIHDESLWGEAPGDVVQPPDNSKRLPGRPKVSRRRGPDEPSAGVSDARRSCSVRCTRCKILGHNSRTCSRGQASGTQASGTHAAGTQTTQATSTHAAGTQTTQAAGTHATSTQTTQAAGIQSTYAASTQSTQAGGTPARVTRGRGTTRADTGTSRGGRVTRGRGTSREVTGTSRGGRVTRGRGTAREVTGISKGGRVTTGTSQS